MRDTCWVSPYRHLADLPLLSEEERAEIFELCIQSELTLRKVVSPDAFNVGFNLGSAAGAGVPDHLHMHIVPRWNGDNNFMPVLADIRWRAGSARGNRRAPALELDRGVNDARSSRLLSVHPLPAFRARQAGGRRGRGAARPRPAGC